MSFAVPLASFQVHSKDKAPVFWLLFYVRVLNVVSEFVLEVKSIDSYNVLSRIVLETSSQEGLGEEEP